MTSENIYNVQIKPASNEYCFDKKTIDAIEKKRLISEQKSLDDNSALELHKSKSYIVSLIDKALSKELGTIPGDKCTTREVNTMKYGSLKRINVKFSIVVFSNESKESNSFG